MRAISFDKTSRYLAVGGDQEVPNLKLGGVSCAMILRVCAQVVIVFDMKKKKRVRELKGHHSPRITTACFAPDSEHLATGGINGQALVHNIRNREVVADLRSHENEQFAVSHHIRTQHCPSSHLHGLRLLMLRSLL